MLNTPSWHALPYFRRSIVGDSTDAEHGNPRLSGAPALSV